MSVGVTTDQKQNKSFLITVFQIIGFLFDFIKT